MNNGHALNRIQRTVKILLTNFVSSIYVPFLMIKEGTIVIILATDGVPDNLLVTFVSL